MSSRNSRLDRDDSSLHEKVGCFESLGSYTSAARCACAYHAAFRSPVTYIGSMHGSRIGDDSFPTHSNNASRRAAFGTHAGSFSGSVLTQAATEAGYCPHDGFKDSRTLGLSVKTLAMRDVYTLGLRREIEFERTSADHAICQRSFSSKLAL